MDADTLRAILNAQAMQQQRQHQKTLDAVMERMERLFSAMGAAPAAAPASTAEFYNRHEDIIANDGSTLDDAAKARLIVSKLDAATYARFTNHFLPKEIFDVSLDETVKTLKELFGHNTSVFARRYAYLRTQRRTRLSTTTPDLFRVRLEKCAFLQTEINYFGFVINAEGPRLDPKKIEAIHKMPHPKDVSQLRAFLNLVNFYGTFVEDLHQLPHSSSFNRIKATLARICS
ncbi:hypothetical protein ANCCEY_05923 [Ancylostoma ceylanicum]|uniref:DUF7083 domain-containing protein n=1 Tax=Ancylostoma ceylanicum TaxID=53326 RepID=A0A0D6LT02_9BILA|nr:hypothetical protein ANCCEY_05923 [Ancylostoma ceylanicum]